MTQARMTRFKPSSSKDFLSETDYLERIYSRLETEKRKGRMATNTQMYKDNYSKFKLNDHVNFNKSRFLERSTMTNLSKSM